MTVAVNNYSITWEKLPDDYQLDDEPVDNLNQPLLAAALSEALELAGRIQEPILIATNFGLCATVNGKFVIKAPDWVYVRSVLPDDSDQPRRSYTPNLEGEVPSIVMEFLSATEGGEYSIKPTYPPGKWFFYEQILQVPIYTIFEPATGLLEVYQLNSGRYQLQQPDANRRYWIAGIELFLGVWEGTKADRTGYWLRWWDESEQLLLWGVELVEQERQAKEAALQQAERLAAYLRSLGINPDEISS